jgi:hypothetical protein
MNSTRYNFRAVLALYCLSGLVIALLIHAIVLSSPKYNWIFPVSSTDATTTVNPAPGSK